MIIYNLTVALGDTLKLVLLLDGVRVRRALASVDELLSKTLSDGLDVTERGLAGTGGDQGDGLVDTAEGRDIDGLTTDLTGGTDTSRVLTGTRVDDGVDDDLDGVLLGEEVDDLKGVLDDADSLQLLTVVAAGHHERVGQTLNNGALRLTEALGSVTASGVGDIDGLTDLDVVSEGDVANLNTVVRPLVEELDLTSVLGDVAGQLREGLDLSHYDMYPGESLALIL